MEKELQVPEDLQYTKEHEWARVEGDTATVGITDFAQHALTDVVFVEVPEVGKQVEQFKPAAIVESVKSVSDIYAPVSGEIVDVNTELADHPEYVNSDPYGKGWIYKIKLSRTDEVKNLKNPEEYKEMTNEA